MTKLGKKISIFFIINFIIWIFFIKACSFREVLDLILDDHYVISRALDWNDNNYRQRRYYKEVRYYKNKVSYDNIEENQKYIIILKSSNIIEYFDNDNIIYLKIKENGKILIKGIDKKTKTVRDVIRTPFDIKWKNISGMMFIE